MGKRQTGNQMRNAVETIFFDLDGTLIDHFRCIYRCFAHAGTVLNLPLPDYETVRATVGGSALITASKLYGADHAERAETLFREHFNAIMFEDLHLLPGVVWLLGQLRANGVRTAVFTNKHGEHSRKIIAHLGLDTQLDAVIGTYDTPWRKPEPEFTRYALEAMKADPATTILVGDSPFDVQAAQACGLRAYALTTGIHREAELARIDPPADGVFCDLFAFAAEVLNLSPPVGVR